MNPSQGTECKWSLFKLDLLGCLGWGDPTGLSGLAVLTGGFMGNNVSFLGSGQMPGICLGFINSPNSPRQL